MFEHDQMEDKHFKRKKSIYLIISLIIAFLLASPEDITWARDRLSYLTYAESSWVIMERYISRGILPFLTNEPLFLAINIILSSVFSPDNVVRSIIVISTFGVLYALGKISKYNFWILFFFLFIPQILKNHIIHLRQGLGLSFYLLGLISTNKFGRILKYASMFIHTSFVFLILFEFLDKIFKKINFNTGMRMLFSSILLTIFMFIVPSLAIFFGDRRALEYDFTVAQDASGLGFLFWLIVGGFFIFIIKKDYITAISCYGIMFYLISYFFLDFAARIFENIIPLIIVATLNDSRKEIKVFYTIVFLFYGSIQWYLGAFNFHDLKKVI